MNQAKSAGWKGATIVHNTMSNAISGIECVVLVNSNILILHEVLILHRGFVFRFHSSICDDRQKHVTPKEALYPSHKFT